MNNKDLSVLHHILDYCGQIQETMGEYNSSKERFLKNATFHNAVCLCLLQIGELSILLSDEFTDTNAEIQWREIKLLRNIVAHRYGQVDYNIIWEICLTDIPAMVDFCTIIINEQLAKDRQ